jgi:hypothetical protein
MSNIKEQQVRRVIEEEPFQGRRLFIISFRVIEPAAMNGQQPSSPLNIPCYVVDWQTAASKAAEYIAAFPSTIEGAQRPNVKLELNAIMVGGTILT